MKTNGPPISDAGYAVIAPAAQQISPEKLVAYLESAGWEAMEDMSRPRKSGVWELYEGEGDLKASVFIPFDRSYADFERRMVEAIAIVARVELWSVVLEIPEGLR